MILKTEIYLHYKLSTPTDLILQIEAAETAEQKIIHANIAFSPVDNFARLRAENGIGDRLLMNADDDFSCCYDASIEITRSPIDLAQVKSTPLHQLPADAIRYLMPSRYCYSDEFQHFVTAEFGHLSGGNRIVAMRDWIAEKCSYVTGSSNASTSAMDTFVQRQGVCRDFAHLMIALTRASGIPARFASVLAPNVEPPDFHAVAEIYLDNAWHLIDPTGMAMANEMAIIGVGMDAAEVAFMTSYGNAEMVAQTVKVSSS